MTFPPQPFALSPLTTAILFSLSASALAQTTADAPPHMLNEVLIEASKLEFSGTTLRKKDLAQSRPATSDSAALLRDIPGVSIQAAGGVSSFPSIHGFADDRLRINVDGIDFVSACANHMNTPLSYIDPSNVEEIRVYKGITPVSVGGDSLGGTILVKSAGPVFAAEGEVIKGGEIGGFYRSNGNATGANFAAHMANDRLSVRYAGSTAESSNVSAAGDFKKPAMLAPIANTIKGSTTLSGNEIGSTAYRAQNQSLDVGYKLDAQQTLNLKVGLQSIPYQGFPNQHMDMTGNDSTQVSLNYVGRFDWGKLDVRAYHEHTQHKMDFYNDKKFYFGNSTVGCHYDPANPNACIAGMPMNTDGKNTGLSIKADIVASERDTWRIGTEWQQYRLKDWWPPSGGSMMAPLTFWNINDGKRDKIDVFAEVESRWSSQWLSLIGARSSKVSMDTDNVQGYNAMTGMMGYAADANAFNAKSHARTDHNLDLTALLRFTPEAGQSYEGGYARKTRSPNLYERYSWSTNGMAMTMNNWVNDGNGYLGNLDLKPEVAHTFSVTADWRDAFNSQWGVQLTPYYSYVKDYINAICAPGKTCKTGQFNYLSLANQDAQVYGMDLSGFRRLGNPTGLGMTTLRGIVNYSKGNSITTGDSLYNLMPLNAKLALDQQAGSWNHSLEWIAVSKKDNLSQVRGEMPTSGYQLFNLRSSYQWNQVRFDIGIENLTNKMYYLPVGGAYIGQGSTMSLNNALTPYGVQMPGMGRSIYTGLNIKF